MCATNFKTRFLALALLLTAGCAALPSPGDHNAAADRLALAGGLRNTYIKTRLFTLAAYYRTTDAASGALNLYIEGDGAAWRSHTQLSDDPTPRNLLVLELAGMDPARKIAYLARPCQYPMAGAPPCDPAYWSNRRFSREVVDGMDEAVSALLILTGTERINLIGYSGGAAIAVLLAARRNDVVSLRTVAGNLDPDRVNRHHHVSPLKDALNPMDVAEKLKGLPQRHFSGGKDAVVPPFIAQSFLNQTGRSTSDGITMIEDATHTSGWRERWRALLTLPLPDH